VWRLASAVSSHCRLQIIVLNRRVENIIERFFQAPATLQMLVETQNFQKSCGLVHTSRISKVII
jgi:hypothetical protein